jgi:hypothetical protein
VVRVGGKGKGHTSTSGGGTNQAYVNAGQAGGDDDFEEHDASAGGLVKCCPGMLVLAPLISWCPSREVSSLPE